MTVFSASADCGSKDVCVLAVIIPKLELRDIERHVLPAYFMKRPYDTALQDRPEAFNRVGVDRTDDIAASAMVHGAVRIVSDIVVGETFIRRQQADFVRNHLADEALGGLARDALENARNHVALALYSADDGRLVGGFRWCGPCLFLPLPPM